MAQATVKIRVLGGSQALRDLQGIRRESGRVGETDKRVAREGARAAKQAADDKTKEAKRAEREAVRAAERAAKEQTRQAREVAKAAAREAEKQRREADRLATHWQRLSQRSADQRIREEKRVAREAERTTRAAQASARRSIRSVGGFVGGTAAAALAGGVSAAGTARGVAGVDDVATRVRKANDFREVTTILGSNAEMSEAEIARLQKTILDVAIRNAKDPLEIVEGLAAGQERFNLLKPLAENIDDITKAAKSSMGTVPQFIGMIGAVTTAFGLSADEMGDALNILVGAARKGAIDPGQFASAFASTASIFAIASGQRGLGGLRQFVGTSQAIGAGQFGSENDQAEAATRVERFISTLGEADKQAKLKKLGVDVVSADGTIDVGRVIEQIANAPKLATPTLRQEVFNEIRANQGLEVLLAQRAKVLAGEEGAIDFSIGQIEADEGRAGTAEILRRLEKGGTLEVQRQAIEMQKHTIENLGDFNAQILLVTKTSAELEKSFGSLALWASSIGATALTGGAAVLTAKVAGAGAAGAAGAGTGAALTAAGTGALGVSAGVLSAGVLGAAALGAGVGLGIDALSGTKALGGKKLSQRLEDALVGFGDPDIARGGPRGLAREEMKIEVDVKDSRTEAKVTRKQSRGPTVTTSLGPLVIGAN